MTTDAQPKPTTHQYLTDEEGNKTAIVLPIEEYYELLEELADIPKIHERRGGEMVSPEEMKRRLGL